MRRSIGPGMGNGGGGGGGMIKTVQRAMRGGIGGGASPAEAPPYSHFTTRSTTSNNSHHNHQQPINTALSLSSNNLHHPAPAALPPKWASPTTSECEESDWECIDDDSESSCHVNIGVSNSNSNDDYVFGRVPSKDEVHHAVSSLQEVVDEYYGMMDKEKIVSCPPMTTTTSCYFEKSGSDQSDWSEPTSLDLICNSRTRVYDAFHLMQTDPSVQRMVISLSSDKAVWDAVMKNEVVRELQESISEEEKSIWEEDDHVVNVGNPVKQLLRWMFVNTKDKVVEIVDRITKIVNDLLVQPTNPKRDHDQAAGTTASTSTSPAAAAAADSSSFQEKLKSSFLLSIMVLVIVVVTRATRKA